jgi:hypothetical protein
LETELTLLQKLNHENIVKYVESIRSEEHLNIILEFMENGSLQTILKKFGKFPETLTAVYVMQVLEGLQYLHEQGVIHRFASRTAFVAIFFSSFSCRRCFAPRHPIVILHCISRNTFCFCFWCRLFLMSGPIHRRCRLLRVRLHTAEPASEPVLLRRAPFASSRYFQYTLLE